MFWLAYICTYLCAVIFYWKYIISNGMTPPVINIGKTDKSCRIFPRVFFLSQSGIFILHFVVRNVSIQSNKNLALNLLHLLINWLSGNWLNIINKMSLRIQAQQVYIRIMAAPYLCAYYVWFIVFLSLIVCIILKFTVRSSIFYDNLYFLLLQECFLCRALHCFRKFAFKDLYKKSKILIKIFN